MGAIAIHYAQSELQIKKSQISQMACRWTAKPHGRPEAVVREAQFSQGIKMPSEAAAEIKHVKWMVNLVPS